MISGALPEELKDQSNLQRLLEQIQQDPGSKQSHVPDGGEEVTPKPG